MLLNTFFKSFTIILKVNKSVPIAENIVKMDTTIARLRQAKQVDL